jgi:hypothetical protein
MEVAIKDVSLNLLTAGGRVEVTVTTVTGQVIVFPSARVEARRAALTPGSKTTVYTFAQTTVPAPTPKTYTFFMEDEEGCPPRHRLDESDG